MATLPTKRMCFFCVHNLSEINFKDPKLLVRFLSSYGKINARRRTGLCAWHQRKFAQSVKRARIMGFLPFIQQ